MFYLTAIVKEENATDSKDKRVNGGSPQSQTSKTLDPNNLELQKRIRYTREKKEQLKALLGTSRQSSRDGNAVIVTTYSTVRPSSDSACPDISEATSSQSHLIKPSTSSGNAMTNYPYKPARCKSYIVETDSETPLLKPSSPSDAKTQNVKPASQGIDNRDAKDVQDKNNV